MGHRKNLECDDHKAQLGDQDKQILYYKDQLARTNDEISKYERSISAANGGVAAK